MVKEELTAACLLAASGLPDKRASARCLQSKVGTFCSAEQQKKLLHEARLHRSLAWPGLDWPGHAMLPRCRLTVHCTVRKRALDKAFQPAFLIPQTLHLSSRIAAALPPLPQQLTSAEATHAAAALQRIAAHLPDGEFEELAGDLLGTVGLRTAAWQRIVAMLLERGTPKVGRVVGRKGGARCIALQRLRDWKSLAGLSGSGLTQHCAVLGHHGITAACACT